MHMLSTVARARSRVIRGPRPWRSWIRWTRRSSKTRTASLKKKDERAGMAGRRKRGVSKNM
eukprot:7255626-Pyramimonas_sp.AAC.1